MAVITLTKITGNEGSGLVFQIRALESLTSEYESNSTLFPIPLQKATDAIAMKVAGSVIRIHITCVLNNEQTTVVSGKSILSGDEQYAFLNGYDGNGFPPVDILDLYELDINIGVLIKGMVQSISFTKNKGETVWVATINFDVGIGIEG